MRVHVNEKKREDKRGYCAYENKTKTNYTFITIIGYTIIIAIIYIVSHSPTYFIIDIICLFMIYIYV